MRLINISRLLALCVLLVCASSAYTSDAVWQPVKERRDFKIDAVPAITESAFAELSGVYGAELDIDALKKDKIYIHTINSDEYNKEIIVVMIEDRYEDEPDCYYEVVFERQDMSVLSVGGILLDVPAAEHLNSVVTELYAEPEAPPQGENE